MRALKEEVEDANEAIEQLSSENDELNAIVEDLRLQLEASHRQSSQEKEKDLEKVVEDLRVQLEEAVEKNSKSTKKEKEMGATIANLTAQLKKSAIELKEIKEMEVKKGKEDGPKDDGENEDEDENRPTNGLFSRRSGVEAHNPGEKDEVKEGASIFTYGKQGKEQDKDSEIKEGASIFTYGKPKQEKQESDLEIVVSQARRDSEEYRTEIERLKKTIESLQRESDRSENNSVQMQKTMSDMSEIGIGRSVTSDLEPLSLATPQPQRGYRGVWIYLG